MASKLPRTSMSLKEFMVHQEVIKLYRNIMKTIRQIPDKHDRDYMRSWAKSDFRANKDIKDEIEGPVRMVSDDEKYEGWRFACDTMYMGKLIVVKKADWPMDSSEGNCAKCQISP